MYIVQYFILQMQCPDTHVKTPKRDGRSKVWWFDKPMFDHLCAVTKVKWCTLMAPMTIVWHQSLMVFKQECQCTKVVSPKCNGSPFTWMHQQIIVLAQTCEYRGKFVPDKKFDCIFKPLEFCADYKNLESYHAYWQIGLTCTDRYHRLR